MIITDSFVMLNYPKTGSTFARQMVKKAYKQRCNRLQKLAIKLKLKQAPVQDYKTVNTRVGVVDQHGNINLIPREHSHKTVVSIMRDPVARYVSQYTYQWWAKYPPASEDEIKKIFNSFPDLGFEEFYEMSHRFALPRFLEGALDKEAVQDRIGLQTAQFLWFFVRDAGKVIADVVNGKADLEKILLALKDIVFLHQENLDEELKAFLINRAGFSDGHVSFISDKSKINASATKGFDGMAVPEHVRQKIYQREAFLYEIFPEYRP